MYHSTAQRDTHHVRDVPRGAEVEGPGGAARKNAVSPRHVALFHGPLTSARCPGHDARTAPMAARVERKLGAFRRGAVAIYGGTTMVCIDKCNVV